MREMVFDEWVVGGPPFGRLNHAVIRRQGGLPGTYICVSLCGARGRDGVVRATNTPYTPAAVDDACTKCAREWTAKHAPQIEGWTKECASCRTDKPVSQFHTDARTKDGMTKACYECRQAAKAAVQAAQDIAERAAQESRRQAEATSRAHRHVAHMQTFQDSSLTPTYRCTEGHVLAPTIVSEPSVLSGAAYDRVAWTCECGTRPVVWNMDDPANIFALLDAVKALETLTALAIPAPCEMAQVDA